MQEQTLQLHVHVRQESLRSCKSPIVVGFLLGWLLVLTAFQTHKLNTVWLRLYSIDVAQVRIHAQLLLQLQHSQNKNYQ
jgi:hypothetical protein